MVTSGATKTGTSTVTFASSFSNNPNMITGIAKMLSTPSDILEFNFNLSSITTSSFVLKYIIGASTTVSSMSIMYGAVNASENSKMGTYTWVQFSNVVNSKDF